MLRLTVDREASLSNCPPELALALKQRLTIANPKYRDALKYGRWIGKNIKPTLLFYRRQGPIITFPRGFAGQAIRLCRTLLHTTPEIIDHRLRLAEIAITFHGTLRDYQQQAVDALCKREFGVLEAGTGSGKTVIALAVMAQRRQPTLVLVHTKELLYQWQERTRQFLELEAGLVGDGHFQLAPVTIAIVNSARRRLPELTSRFGQICVDECHRVPATLFTEVVTAFSSHYALGLSATAFRRDGLTNLIHFYLGDPIHRVKSELLTESGAILEPEYHLQPTAFTYRYRGDYPKLIKALTTNEQRNRLIAADIIKACADTAGTILVVSDRVAHCQRLADLLEESAISCAQLTGKLPTETRSRMVQEIRDGAIKVVLSTVQLIGEGFDCPGLETLFLTTPIKFSGRLLQVVGRILRPAAGKKPQVFDYLDPVPVLRRSATARQQLFVRDRFSFGS